MSTPAGVPAALFQKWMHSFEEDSGGVEVYRPEGHAFPRARGRAGIEFRADGASIEWQIGRGDAPTAAPGRWQIAGPRQVRVNVSSTSFTLEILECTDQILKVRRR